MKVEGVIIVLSVNKNLQDYFIKLAPDFSVFNLAEKFYYDNNLTSEYFNVLFSLKKNITSLVNSKYRYPTEFLRGMFCIHAPSANIEIFDSIDGKLIPSDEYVVFPLEYDSSVQVIIVIQDKPFIITSTVPIDLIIGVAF